jgi:TonB family protein
MLKFLQRIPARSLSALLVRLRVLGTVAPLAMGLAVLGLTALNLASMAQQPAAQDAAPAPAQPAQQPAQQATPEQTAPDSTAAPAQAPAQPAASSEPAASEPAQNAAPDTTQGTTPQPAAPATAQSTPASAPEQGGITEDELKQLLAGKQLYLRGRYLDDSLSFNEHGGLAGHSPQGSYTLCLVQIDKVHLTKHKVELVGARYGLHFLGALPYEDPSKAVDQVKITPKKKVLRITIDREVVVKPKKVKDKEKGKGKDAKVVPAKGAAAPAAGSANPATGATPPEPTDADEAKAEIAAAPAEERPADPDSVTTTISPAHATATLKDALDKIFAPGLDDKMMASMPAFWQLYYQAAAAKTDYRPKDASILRQNTVDTKAKMESTFEPASNEYAQSSGVAGMALYHAVIGADGKVSEIAVARPIGFGLDENAVSAIQNAKFSPAMKDGKPVPVVLDLQVMFRIYSKRTAAAAATPTEEAGKPTAPILPGPYSVRHPPQPAPQAQPQGQQ